MQLHAIRGIDQKVIQPPGTQAVHEVAETMGIGFGKATWNEGGRLYAGAAEGVEAAWHWAAD